MVKTKSTNPVIQDLIKKLEEASEENEAPIWKDIAESISSKRSRASVNISKIDRNAEEGEIVVVPGKVLGAGEFSKEVKVAAFKASKAAQDKIEEKGEYLTIQQLLEKNPEGENLKILK